MPKYVVMRIHFHVVFATNRNKLFESGNLLVQSNIIVNYVSRNSGTIMHENLGSFIQNSKT